MEPGVRSSLCYYCRFRKSETTCLKYNTVPDSTQEEKENDPDLFDGLSKSFYSTYFGVMALKTLASAAFSDFMDYLRYRKKESDVDPLSKNNKHFEYSNFPEHIVRCDRCICYYSNSVVCRCSSCLKDSETHYVILMHGVLTSPLIMADVCKALLEKYPTLFIYFPVSVSGKTLYGTNYVLKFLIDELDLLFSKIPNKFKLSLIGHSFGGILLRYLFIYLLKTNSISNDVNSGEQTNTHQDKKEEPKTKEKEHGKRITWKNMITIATPNSGIYENNVEFKKLVSLIGSETVRELENDTIDLLFLLKDDGHLNKFENVIIYGNISGDMMVAPRTSIILPNHMFSNDKLSQIGDYLHAMKGEPVNVLTIPDVDALYSELQTGKDEAEEEEEEGLYQYESVLTMETLLDSTAEKSDSKSVENLILEKQFFHKFKELVKEKITKTKHLDFIHKLMVNPQNLKIRESMMSKRRTREKIQKEIFTDEDFAKFETTISEIVGKSNPELLEQLGQDDGFFYFEVLLSLMFKLKASKFAVYIPRILMPHRSIITFNSPVSHEQYTNRVLQHIANAFSD